MDWTVVVYTLILVTSVPTNVAIVNYIGDKVRPGDDFIN